MYVCCCIGYKIQSQTIVSLLKKFLSHKEIITNYVCKSLCFWDSDYKVVSEFLVVWIPTYRSTSGLDAMTTESSDLFAYPTKDSNVHKSDSSFGRDIASKVWLKFWAYCERHLCSSQLQWPILIPCSQLFRMWLVSSERLERTVSWRISQHRCRVEICNGPA